LFTFLICDYSLFLTVSFHIKEREAIVDINHNPSNIKSASRSKLQRFVGT
jgi:hypothetical protein